MEHDEVRIAYFAKDQGVRQVQGTRFAIEKMEARSSTMSDVRQRNAKQQLQNSSRVHQRTAKSGSGRNNSRRSSSEMAANRAAAKAETSWMERVL